MSTDFFHLSFVVIFLSFTLVRMYYHRLAARTAGQAEYKEGRLHTALRLLVGVPFMLGLLAYMVRPALFAWARFSAPNWMQWLGLALGLACLPLIVWVQRALGSNFSTTLHVRDEHTLVTRGPYRWVRHPMYTVLFALEIALLLLTQNWFIGGVPLAALSLIVATRLRREEQTMLDRFGDEYRAYMSRTGRFWPRGSAF